MLNLPSDQYNSSTSSANVFSKQFQTTFGSLSYGGLNHLQQPSTTQLHNRFYVNGAFHFNERYQTVQAHLDLELSLNFSNESTATIRFSGDSLTGQRLENSWVTQSTTHDFEAQETYTGELSNTDDLNPTREGCFKDDYVIQSDTDQVIQVEMSSFDIDTYLQIIDADTGDVIAYDDDSAGDLNSYLEFEAEAGVEYLVRATSYWAEEIGDYTLEVDTVSPSPCPTPTPDNFNRETGYGLINAAAVVASAAGVDTFEDVLDEGNSWNNNLINAPEAWARGYTGSDVIVAVIDTGVDYNHQDLDENIWINSGEIACNGVDDDGNGYIDDVQGWDFVDSDSDPMDVYGHGTHVSGTIAAENDGQDITGVAYNAQIMPVRVLDDWGFGWWSDIANGIYYAADNGADVINLSLGSDFPDDEIEAAIEYAASLGAVVVMAAGNSSDDQPGYPARYATDWGLSVGAIDRDRQLADFSNRAGTDSQLHHIVAPGVEIESTLPNNCYDFYDGTSMATPHVAGVVALMLSANPDLIEEQIRQIIIDNSIQLET